MNRPLTFAQACANYPHRFTMTHVPNWAKKQFKKGKYYAPHYRSCEEWYKLTKFPGENGISPRSKYCESYSLTWPLGKFLKKPFEVIK